MPCLKSGRANWTFDGPQFTIAMAGWFCSEFFLRYLTNSCNAWPWVARRPFFDGQRFTIPLRVDFAVKFLISRFLSMSWNLSLKNVNALSAFDMLIWVKSLFFPNYCCFSNVSSLFIFSLFSFFGFWNVFVLKTDNLQTGSWDWSTATILGHCYELYIFQIFSKFKSQCFTVSLWACSLDKHNKCRTRI